MHNFLLILALVFSEQSLATIYGTDTRQPIRSDIVSTELARRSRAVAILIPNTDIENSAANDGGKDFYTNTIEKNQYLCPKQKYAQLQSFFVSCTGFLVAPDILVTAGHCMLNFGEARDQAPPGCTDFSWYFDFELNREGAVVTKNIAPEKIFACERILHAAHKMSRASDGSLRFDDDFAVIKLKRPVLDREPLKITAARPRPSEMISMIGHPLGGPKMQNHGRLLSTENGYDRANVGGFPGNSGSPVFNRQGEAFGILVRGYPESLFAKPGQQCHEVNICDSMATRCKKSDDLRNRPGDHLMPLALIDVLKDLGLIK